MKKNIFLSFLLVLSLLTWYPALNPDQARASGAELYKAGDRANRYGQYESAARLLTQAIESEYLTGTELASAHFSRAFAHRSLGNFDQALADYDRALEIQPSLIKDEYFLGARAKTHLGLGNLDQAMKDVEAGLNLSPESASLMDARALVFQAKAQYRKALDDFRRALAISPNYWQVKADLAWLLSTCPDAAVRNSGEAVPLAESAAKIKPDYSTMDVLAAAYAEAGRYDEAVQLMEMAIETLNQLKREKLADQLRPHLDSYKNKTPWRQ